MLTRQPVVMGQSAISCSLVTPTRATGVPVASHLTDAKYWTEETAKNNPSDRRFMQSAGPFTLKSRCL